MRVVAVLRLRVWGAVLVGLSARCRLILPLTRSCWSGQYRGLRFSFVDVDLYPKREDEVQARSPPKFHFELHLPLL